jgi:hypothetical protein
MFHFHVIYGAPVSILLKFDVPHRCATLFLYVQLFFPSVNIQKRPVCFLFLQIRENYSRFLWLLAKDGIGSVYNLM